MGVIYKNGVAYSGDTPEMTGATSSAAGKSGLVPTPAAGDQEKFLKADGTWSIPEGKDLVQSGTTSISEGTLTVTFPIEFTKVPAVMAIGGVPAPHLCTITSTNKSGMTIKAYSSTTGSLLTTATIKWMAIGEV